MTDIFIYCNQCQNSSGFHGDLSYTTDCSFYGRIISLRDSRGPKCPFIKQIVNIPVGLYTVENGSESPITIEIYEELTYQGTIKKFRNAKNFKGFEFKGLPNGHFLKPVQEKK